MKSELFNDLKNVIIEMSPKGVVSVGAAIAATAAVSIGIIIFGAAASVAITKSDLMSKK